MDTVLKFALIFKNRSTTRLFSTAAYELKFGASRMKSIDLVAMSSCAACKPFPINYLRVQTGGWLFRCPDLRQFQFGIRSFFKVQNPLFWERKKKGFGSERMVRLRNKCAQLGKKGRDIIAVHSASKPHHQTKLFNLSLNGPKNGSTPHLAKTRPFNIRPYLNGHVPVGNRMLPSVLRATRPAIKLV